jgi:hypothetical protein
MAVSKLKIEDLPKDRSRFANDRAEFSRPGKQASAISIQANWRDAIGEWNAELRLAPGRVQARRLFQRNAFRSN